MSDSTQTGGFAFPVAWPAPNAPEAGMTLRDYFAAKALQGLISQSKGMAVGSDPAFGASYAYQMADAMIAERAK
jgi:hypothetical protein